MVLLKKNEVAEIARVRPRTIDSWVQNGTLKTIKAGRLNRFRISDLERFLKLPPGSLRVPPRTDREPESGR